MALVEFQTMSGGNGSEVTFVRNDVTGALFFQVGNDRGSPLVNVGVELQDGTIIEFQQNARTIRTAQYRDGLQPAPRATEVVVEEDPEEVVNDEDGNPTNQRRRRQRFRRRQAIKAADRAKVSVISGPDGDYLDFKRTWRQEVY